MRRIIKIIRVRDMGKYKLTDALMDDGTEASAYTPLDEKFEAGDKVEVFFHEQWNTVKFRRKPNV